MGRRSTSTTKSGKYMNPTDQARKEARRRELKKNKKQRQLVRDAVLRSKNVRELCGDLDKLEEMELGLRESEASNEKAVKEKKKRTSDTLLKILKFYEKNDRHQYVEAKKLYEDSENKRRKLREEVFKPYVSTSQQELEAISLPDIPLPPGTPGTTLAPSDIPLPNEHKSEPLPAGLTPPGPPPGPIPERARRIPDSLLQLKPPDTTDHIPKGILKQQRHEEDDSQSSSGSDSGNSSDEEEHKSEEPRPKRSVRFAPDEDEPSKTSTTSEVVANASDTDKPETIPTVTPADIRPTPAPPPIAQHFQSAIPYPPMLPPHPPGVISNPPVMPVQFRPPPPRDMFPPPPPGPLPFMPGQPPPQLPHMGLPPMPPSFVRGSQPPPPPPPPGVAPQQSIHTSQPSAVLSAPPVLTGSSSHDSGGKDGATISAEPQLRNTQAEVTKFMPTSLRIRRDQPRPSKPRPKAMPIRPMKTGDRQKAIISSLTKDDAYTQFMKEMEGLM